MMLMLSPRDLRIVKLAHTFGQLSSSHIRTLEFSECKSHTSCNRVLQRLTAIGFLAPIERRGVGGWRGGSNVTVYQLARKGWQYLGLIDERRNYTAIRPHMLAIADVFTAGVEASRHGDVTLHSVQVEEEGLVDINGVQIIPDLYMYLNVSSTGRDGHMFIEVDMGTENKGNIEDKLKRYGYAYRNWTGETFPLVIFLARDLERVDRLKRMIANSPAKQDLFRVALLDSFPQLLWSDTK